MNPQAQSKHYDLIIVGGGAAGLFAAAIIAEILPKGRKIILLEKTNSLGNKLLLSGNGQCNFTHSGDMKDYQTKYGQNYKNIKKALFELSNQKLIDYLSTLGVDSLIRNDKKVFPKSLEASDIKNALIEKAKSYPVEFKTKRKLNSIAYSDNYIQLLTSSNELFTTKYLLLCTGGASYPKTGSDGDILRILNDLDVEMIPFKPALVVPTMEMKSNKDISTLAGITLKTCTIALYRSTKKLWVKEGPLLFTHTGLSGPLILDSSRFFEKGDVIRLYPTNFIDFTVLDKVLLNLIKQHPIKKIKNILLYIGVPEAIINFQCADIKEILYTGASELSKFDRKTLVYKLLNTDFIITEIGNLNSAMSCSGGVAWSEIDKNDMSFKKYPNIYIAGECLDIDGDTGGYNIHAAFATANLAIKSLSQGDKI